MRLFVALDLPQTIRQTLASLQSGLPGAKWVEPENLHITLRFIGEVDNGLADDIDQALSLLYSESFSLSLSGIGTFEEGRKVKMLWAGLQENQDLYRLQTKVEAALKRAGVRLQKRKFKPHITLARFRVDPPPEKLGTFFHTNALIKSAPFKVNSFFLYSSALTDKGPFYRQEVEYPLASAIM